MCRQRFEVCGDLGCIKELHSREIKHSRRKQKTGDVIVIRLRAGKRLRFFEILQRIFGGEASFPKLVRLTSDVSERLRLEWVVPHPETGFRTERLSQ